MLYNYMKIAFRSFIRQKLYSVINVLGLAVGMASAFVIMLWVMDELSYDKFHHNGDNIYRVVREINTGNDIFHRATTPGPLPYALKDEIPEIIDATHCEIFGEWFIQYQDIGILQDGCCFADPDFLRMFDFKLAKGNPLFALRNPHSIIISKEMAVKFFGSDDPVGKTVKADNRVDLMVTGVLEDVPHNSSLKFNYIVPFKLADDLSIGDIDAWGSSAFNTYIQLNQNASEESVNHAVSGFLKKHTPKTKSTLYLQPFFDIHLYSDLQADLEGRGNIRYVRIFASLAVVIILVACINFMNLATAQSHRRSKEVGLRKLIGAFRKDLVLQFLSESIAYSIFAMIIAAVMIELVLPGFNSLTGKNIELAASGSFVMFLVMVLIAVFTGIIAGSYPALLLSSFQPVKALKRFSDTRLSPARIRKILVVLQFSLTICLIASALLVAKQLGFMQNKDLGYDKEYVVHVEMSNEAANNYEALRTAFMQMPEVRNVSSSFQLPTDISSSAGGAEWEGKDPAIDIRFNVDFVEFGYVETLGIEIVQGRSFSEEFATDFEEAFIINQTAARTMGLDDPIGKSLSVFGMSGKIVGVVKDFHFQSLHTGINPMILKIYPDWCYRLYIRVNPGDMESTVGALNNTWTGIVKNQPFQFKFLDDTLSELYTAESRMRTVIGYFTALTIFVSCLGLFSLASFSAEQRTKEIGIRKVLGASVAGIIGSLAREFMILVIAANVIAIPLAYFVMNKWLANFAYRIDVSSGIFIFAAVLALLIAMLTVSFQSIRAATSDPVKALKYE